MPKRGGLRHTEIQLLVNLLTFLKWFRISSNINEILVMEVLVSRRKAIQSKQICRKLQKFHRKYAFLAKLNTHSREYVKKKLF